jgi:small subunit ribosomal protein S5
VRAVVEAVGLRYILRNIMGSAKILTVAHATLDALMQLKSAEELAAIRGKQPRSVLPFWRRKKDEAK